VHRRRVAPLDPAGVHDLDHVHRRLDPDDAEQHDLRARRGLRAHGESEGIEAVADHVDLRRAQRVPAEPRGLRDVARLRRQRCDPRRVRLQLSRRRLDVPAVGREPGLRADAGVVPAPDRGGARRDPRRRRRDRPARSSHPGQFVTAQSMTATVEPTTATPGPDPPLAEARRGFGTDLWRAVARNRKALAGLVLLVFFLVLAVFPGQIAPHDPQAESYLPGLGPSSHHWFGTTAYGQDVLSQLIWGTRQSVIIAFAAGGLATALAVLVGVSAAYLGGIADGLLSLLTDVILVIPIFPLIIVIAAYEKNSGLFTLVVVLGVCVALLGAAFALLNYAFDEISNPALRLRRLERKGAQLRKEAAPVELPPSPDKILEVRELSVAYASDDGPVVAVDHVDFDLAPGEFLGIVGESGCGKSTLLYAIARLLGAPLAGEITHGQVIFKGRDMVTLADKELRHIRWRDYSVVMQSAMNALNPVLTVAEQMRDAC